MHPTDRKARIAGSLYLLMAPLAVFALQYVPRSLIVRGDAAATANNVLEHEMLFRAGSVAGLLSAVVFILLAVALYRLLSDVNKTHAALMVILAVVLAAIMFPNEVNNIAALTLFRGGGDLSSMFDGAQRAALGMFFLDLHRYGLIVSEIFWGLWLFPFAVLVMRSGFLPRILGVLLIVNGFAYVAAWLTSLLWPAYGPAVSRAILPALMGELWITLWLLFKGAKVQPAVAEAT